MRNNNPVICFYVLSGACLIIGIWIQLFATIMIISSSCIIQDGNITSDPFGMCDRRSNSVDVMRSRGQIQNVDIVPSVLSPGQIWGIDLKIHFSSGNFTRSHILLQKGNFTEASIKAMSYPINEFRWFNINAKDTAEPYSGKRSLAWLIVTIPTFGVLSWILYRYIENPPRTIQNTSRSTSGVKKNCVNSICLIALMIWAIGFLFHPKCNTSEMECFRFGTSPLLITNAQYNTSTCTDSSCTITWRLMNNSFTPLDTVSLDGFCQEWVPTFALVPQTYETFVLVNPSTRSNCTEISEQDLSPTNMWICQGIVIGLFIFAVMFYFITETRGSRHSEREQPLLAAQSAPSVELPTVN